MRIGVLVVDSGGLLGGRIGDAVAERMLCQNLAFSALRYCGSTNQVQRIGTTTTAQTGPLIFPHRNTRSNTRIAIIFRDQLSDYHHDASKEPHCHAATEPHHVPGDPPISEFPHPVTTCRPSSPAEPARLQCPAGQGDLVRGTVQASADNYLRTDCSLVPLRPSQSASRMRARTMIPSPPLSSPVRPWSCRHGK